MKKRWFKESSSTLQRGQTNFVAGMGKTTYPNLGGDYIPSNFPKEKF
jgi:hypothetical protein